MGKTIIISQKQLNEVLGANFTYLDNAGTDDFKEYPGTEVSAETNTSTRRGMPKTTDDVASSLAVKDGFWRTRGGRHGGIGSLNCSKEKKERIQESNSALEGRFFSLDPTTERAIRQQYEASKTPDDSPGKMSLAKIIEDGGLEYTNATTMKSRMDKIPEDSVEYQELGGKALHRFLNVTLGNATGMISMDKASRKAKGEDNVYQKAGGTKDSGNGRQHSGNGNIIMR